MKVLITGAGGMVGRNLVDYLTQHDIECIPTDLSGFESSGDLLDSDFVFKRLGMLDFDAVVHLAAITDLKKTIDNPRLCYEVNCFGTLNMLELAVRKKVKRFVFACYDERTRVFTTNGLKSYSELSLGDHVFTRNASTGEIEIKPIKKIYVYPYDGRMIHFKGKRIDLLVTPNHNMLVQIPGKSHGKRVWRTVFESADSVATRSVCRLASGTWRGFPIETLQNQLGGTINAEDLFYLCGLFIGDGYLNGKQYQVVQSGRSKLQLMGSRDELGRFTSSPLASSRREYFYPRIFLYIPAGDKSRHKIEAALARNNIRWSGYKKSVYLKSDFLYRFFEQCYDASSSARSAHTKRIPRWMLAAPPQLLKALLQGLLDSDGSRGQVLFTVSVGLVEDVMEISAKLGSFTTCSLDHNISQIDGRRVESTIFVLGISSRAGTPMFGGAYDNVRAEDYHGKVFCLEVENHNFLVEREGKIAFSGNSSANVFGAPRKNPVSESAPIDPRIPYDYSKVIGENMAMSYHRSKGLPVTITRGWLLFGEHDQPSRAMIRFIRACLSNQPITLYNNGRDTTAPTHVYNYAKLVFTLLNKDEAVGEAFNFGGEKVVSVRQLAELIKKITDASSELVPAPPRSELEKDPQVSYPSTRKIKTVLGYRHEYTLEQGIRRTVDWVRRGSPP